MKMILKAFLFLLFAACAFLSRAKSLDSANDTYYDNNPSETNDDGFRPRIIEGMIPYDHPLPFVVFIVSYRYNISCTGSIIARRYVLTARHCLEPKDENDTLLLPLKKAKHYFVVNAGSQHKYYGVHYQIEDVFTPPDRRSYALDLIVLRLDRIIPFHRKFAFPVALKKWEPLVGDIFLVAGHGNHLVGIQNCSESSYVVNRVTVRKRGTHCWTRPWEFCGHGHMEGTCQGDSGGPVFLEQRGLYYQIGMATSGLSFINEDRTGFIDHAMYLALDTVCDWIVKVTERTATCVEQKQFLT